MLAALATTLFFACNAIFANRSAQRLGSNRANLARLAVAVLVLAAWAHTRGGGLASAAVGWFLLSGMAGFGVGGVAMFQALPRTGSALAMLIVQCGSAVVAAAVEWRWLGTRLTAAQLLLITVTLAGVALGLLPRSRPSGPAPVVSLGIAWAILSACGQGAGAVLSRKAFQTLRAAHEYMDPGTSAYQRTLGGLAVAALVVIAAELCSRARSAPPARREQSEPGAAAPRRSQPSRAWPWVLANALAGPVLGVTCFQWALSTTPAGIVQAIVATAPLITLPLAMWLEQARPRLPYFVGVGLAVAGVAGLCLAR